MLFPLSFLSIFTSLAIILFCCVVIARFRQLFDRVKIPIAIFTVLGGITLYTIGFMPSEAVAGESFRVSSVALRAIFSTCRVFLMESDFSEVNEAVQNSSFYVFAFSLVHVLGAMLTILTILSSFGLKFLSRLKLLLARGQQVYIFLGFNEASVSLIKSLKTAGKSRCYIVVESLQDGEEDGNLMLMLREDPFILIDTVWQDLQSLKKLHLPKRLLNKEMYIFALSNDGNKNVKAILNLLNNAQRDKLYDTKTTIYINTTDESAERYFEEINKKMNVNFEFKAFNVPDLSARQLFETYPIHDYLPMDIKSAKALSGFTIFLAGFGPVGVEILRKSIYLGQFIGGNYRAIITDGEMARKKGMLFNKYPGIKNNYLLETLDSLPGSEEFYDVIEKNIASINYIVVELGNDRLNIEAAIEIQRIVKRNNVNKKPIIAVYIASDEDFDYLKSSSLLPDVRFFGRLTDIFTESIIINEAMDKMARKMNALFNSIYNIEPADNWLSLDGFTKESNRSAASNIATKLRLLGLEMKERSDNKYPNKDQNNRKEPVRLMDYLTGEKLDNLAKQEHLRWNAFHFASGWVTWPLSQVNQATKAKDLVNRRHACLVSWEELDDVTQRFNQNPTYQQLDYEQVKNIPSILDYTGYDVFEIE